MYRNKRRGEGGGHPKLKVKKAVSFCRGLIICLETKGRMGGRGRPSKTKSQESSQFLLRSYHMYRNKRGLKHTNYFVLSEN